MSGTTKLLTAGGGGVNLTPASSIASDVTVNVPSQNCTLGIQGPAFSAYQSSAQTISTNTLTKVLFQTEEYDTNSNFASSTFTPTVAGYYQINAGYGVSTTNCTGQLRLYKNGSNYRFLCSTVANAVDVITGSTIVYMNGTTDYLDVYCYITVGQNLTANATSTFFSGCLVRAA